MAAGALPQEKNEVCQVTIAQTEEEVLKKHNERTALQVRLKELEDHRRDYPGNINLMGRKLKAYREYLIAEQEKEAEERAAQLKEAKRLAAEQKTMAKGKKKNADGESILKSSLMRKASKEVSKSGSFIADDKNSKTDKSK